MQAGGGRWHRLSAWTVRRTEPRLWVSIAGAGCVLAIIGLIVVSGDAQAGDGGGGSTVPGMIVFALVVAAGYALMHVFGERPGASAGVTAVVLGVPTLVWFLTFDENSLPPISFETLLGVPALVWIVSYLVGPGRGRPLLLGAGLVFLWLFAVYVVEDPLDSPTDLPVAVSPDDIFGGDQDTVDPFDDDPFADDSFGDDDPFGNDDFGDDDFGDDPFGDDFDDEFDSGFPDARPLVPDDSGGSTSVGVVSVLFGAAYLGAAWLLDRRSLAGAGTPFVVAAHLALPGGIVELSDTLEVAGTGIAFVLVGGLTAWIGAVGARRATTIIGAFEVILGVALVIGDAMQDASATSFGLALFVLGAALVGGSQALHVVTGETPQTTAGPSRFPGRRTATGTVPPWGPPPGGNPPPPPPAPPAAPSGPPLHPGPGAPPTGGSAPAPGAPPTGGGAPSPAPQPPARPPRPSGEAPPPPPPPSGGSAF